MMQTSKKTYRDRLPLVILAAGVVAGTLAPTVSTAGSAPQGGSKPAARKSTDPPVMPEGRYGQDLFLAIDHRNSAEVSRLIRKGADTNARNGLEFTPLALAAGSHQPDVMRLLLDAGAKHDVDTTYGTPLLFAAMGAHAEGAKILLDKGARVNSSRSDGTTVLMMAANAGVPPVVAELLKRGAKVDAQATSGMDALSLAARNGHTEVGRMLLESGADANHRDAEGRTPLMHAAMSGHAAFVRLLLAQGAKVDLRDAGGRTALLLAASYGDYPETVAALLEAGAERTVKTSEGATAGQIARYRGFDQAAKTLGAEDLPARATRTPGKAVAASLKKIQASMRAFDKRAACLSCHHQGLGRMTLAAAQSQGFAPDQALMQEQAAAVGRDLEFIRPMHEAALKDPEAMKQVPLIEINEVNTAYSWLLTGMAYNQQAPKAATAAAAMVLARQQAAEGHWTFSMPRIPMQSSVIALTALTVRSLQAYAPRSASIEMAGRLSRAKSWLESAKPKDTEDRSFRLLGMLWAGSSREARLQAAQELLAQQRPDGGWAQAPGLGSDAYSTGQALYALGKAAGLDARNPAVARGATFLLRTQDADGTWFVNKRAMPANNYMDTGFPHGESQYSSFNGTAWATLGLLAAHPARH